MVNLNGTTRTYNAANQMTNDGTDNITFDDNGNMTMRGTNAYVWDNANRLLSYGGTSYAYDGNSNRISQTVSSTVTQYLVDTQPALSKVLRESDGTNTTYFIHAPRGIFSQYDGTDWEYTVQDALGSVRAMTDAAGVIQDSVNYGDYGVPDTATTGFAFTGEQRDANGLQYHRARYYDPVMGVWASLDSMKTANRYGYVSGSPANMTDPPGLFSCEGERLGLATGIDDEITQNCNDLDTAMRATGSTIFEQGVDSDGMIDFGVMKSLIQEQFGFQIVGYNENNSDIPITECSPIPELRKNVPSRFSLVNLATALIYIQARFNKLGGSVSQHLGQGAFIQLVADEAKNDLGTAGEFTELVNSVSPGRNVFLANRVFTSENSVAIDPDLQDVEGFTQFMQRYTASQHAAVESLQ